MSCRSNPTAGPCCLAAVLTAGRFSSSLKTGRAGGSRGSGALVNVSSSACPSGMGEELEGPSASSSASSTGFVEKLSCIFSSNRPTLPDLGSSGENIRFFDAAKMSLTRACDFGGSFLFFVSVVGHSVPQLTTLRMLLPRLSVVLGVCGEDGSRFARLESAEACPMLFEALPPAYRVHKSMDGSFCGVLND